MWRWHFPVAAAALAMLGLGVAARGDAHAAVPIGIGLFAGASVMAGWLAWWCFNAPAERTGLPGWPDSEGDGWGLLVMLVLFGGVAGVIAARVPDPTLQGLGIAVFLACAALSLRAIDVIMDFGRRDG